MQGRMGGEKAPAALQAGSPRLSPALDGVPVTQHGMHGAAITPAARQSEGGSKCRETLKAAGQDVIPVRNAPPREHHSGIIIIVIITPSLVQRYLYCHRDCRWQLPKARGQGPCRANVRGKARQVTNKMYTELLATNNTRDVTRGLLHEQHVHAVQSQHQTRPEGCYTSYRRTLSKANMRRDQGQLATKGCHT